MPPSKSLYQEERLSLPLAFASLPSNIAFNVGYGVPNIVTLYELDFPELRNKLVEYRNQKLRNWSHRP